MESVTRQTCQQYFDRRLAEGWKCINRQGHNAVLKSPDGLLRTIDLRNDVMGPNPPGTAVNDASTGTVAWNNPEYAKIEGGPYASASTGVPVETNYLKITNFGFSIPADSIINGILVEIKRARTTSSVWDHHIYLVRADGSLGTTDKADRMTQWPELVPGYASYGGYSDLWGEVLTPAIVNNPNFGVVLSAYIAGAGSAWVDYVRISIDYTLTAPPAAPTNVQATDGTHSDKVVVTWNPSPTGVDYQVKKDGIPLGWLGNVTTYTDNDADAPTITPGSAAASDGTSSAHVALSLSGAVANNGATHTYTVIARNAGGESPDSAPDTGYRGAGALTYNWQRSNADIAAGYVDIAGATTAVYNDTGAPADGSGRYYRCRLNAAGASQQYSASDRGYRQWVPPAPPVIPEYQKRALVVNGADVSSANPLPVDTTPGAKAAVGILDEASIAALAITVLGDCAAIDLSGTPLTLALTVEATYDALATAGIKVHVRSSYDGIVYDTQDWDSWTVGFTAGGSIRETRNYDTDPMYLKVLIENLDPAQAVTNVLVIATK